jgi:hypothetical protein
VAAALIAAAVAVVWWWAAPDRIPPGTVQGRYEVRLAGDLIGRMTLGRRPHKGGFLFSDSGVLVLSLGGKVSRMRITTQCRTDGRLRLESFRYTLTGDQQRHLVTGRVQDGKLKVSYRLNQVAGTREFVIQGPLVVSSMVTLYFQRQAKAGRKTLRGYVFDPPTLTLSPYTARFKTIKKQGQTILAADVTRRRTRIKLEIDSQGLLLTQDGPMGQKVSRVRGSFKTPLRPVVDLYQALSIKVSGQVPPPGRRLTRLKIRLDGIGLSGLALNGDGQTLKGRVLTVIAGTENLADYPLPARAQTRWLEPSTFVQADHPLIKKQARAIIQGVARAGPAARRIFDWVYREVKKSPVGPGPDAVSVLKNKRGDCNEHAALFTALARAAGVPARVAVGLVLQDGRFLYHAWAEVWLGRWLAVDPTWRQFPADAGHVRLVYGLDQGVLDLESVVGRLKIHVLAWK